MMNEIKIELPRNVIGSKLKDAVYSACRQVENMGICEDHNICYSPWVKGSHINEWRFYMVQPSFEEESGIYSPGWNVRLKYIINSRETYSELITWGMEGACGIDPRAFFDKNTKGLKDDLDTFVEKLYNNL
tara:strand:- start:381 stop:773 length:393 start_codon:yes stop_codon:yes gene_type:complete